MKAYSKIILFLSFFTCLFCLSTIAQVNEEIHSKVDEEFNLFLFMLLLVFAGAVIGAAVFVFLLLCLLALIAFLLLMMGVITSSLLLGFYYRSVKAGFKSFLTLFCCIACTAVSLGGLYVLNIWLHLHLGSYILLSIALLSGIVAGILLAAASFKLIQFATLRRMQKLQIE